MDKTPTYLALWISTVAVTVIEVIIATSSASAGLKQVSIILLTLAEAVAAAAFYLNLRYETRLLSLLPIAALSIISTLVIVSIAGGA